MLSLWFGSDGGLLIGIGFWFEFLLSIGIG